MNNAKIWMLVTGIVVIASGFLLYSLIRSKETERAVFLVKVQELTIRLAEIDKLKIELEKIKKDKVDAETKSRDEITFLESQIVELKKAETGFKSRIDSLNKVKESLTKYMENSNAVVTKLNKKIDSLQKERDELLAKANTASKEPAAPAFVDPMSQIPSQPDIETEKSFDENPAAGAKLLNDEIVDLGQIIIHPSTNEAARVEHVNSLYGFIVMSAGSEDGLKKDSVVNITRNNRLIAKAVIKKIRENVSSAVTLPEWTREEIKVGDLISVTSLTPLPQTSLKA